MATLSGTGVGSDRSAFGGSKAPHRCCTGAGKTTLGLEVFKRLGKPSLVLSPTRVIRNQWIARLRDFVPEAMDWPLRWTSLDFDEPGFLTSITYQALHVRYRQSEEHTEEPSLEDHDAPDTAEVDILVEHIRDAGIGTLILDEAHHLRAEWWKALDKVIGAVDDLQLVALTVTPPYDVTGHEWSKYQTLCGPIDEQISTPELVQAGTLCPHQDYVWFVALSADKRKRLRAYDAAVANLCDELAHSATFKHAMVQHPWVSRCDDVTPEILDYPELAFALLIFLRFCGALLPVDTLQRLDVDADQLPALDRRWWQVLVHAFLFHPSFVLDEEQNDFKTALAKRLRAQELLSRRELRLNESWPIKRLLASASEKIGVCIDIYRLERSVRGDALRQVILTDFIRDEQGTDNLHHADESLGAWPLFREFLRRPDDDADLSHFAVLTGRLISLHKTHLGFVRAQLAGKPLTALPAPFHPDFVVLDGSLQKLTNALTELLGRGVIRVLVGTRALLGEGWDAPAINSLVLASFVGSFMLANQMRGRAIRIDRQQPDKVASIWHIVAVDNRSPSGLGDLYDLSDRFNTFVGLHVNADRIEGGLKRLALPLDEAFYQGIGNKVRGRGQ